jgi:hypothetical protein
LARDTGILRRNSNAQSSFAPHPWACRVVSDRDTRVGDERRILEDWSYAGFAPSLVSASTHRITLGPDSTLPRLEPQGPGDGQLVSQTIGGWTPSFLPGRWRASGRRGAEDRPSCRVGAVPSRPRCPARGGEGRACACTPRTVPAPRLSLLTRIPMGFGVRVRGP